MKNFKQYNESVRDLLKGKEDAEIGGVFYQ